MPAASPIVATRDRLAGLKAKIDLYSILEQRERCQDSLRDFVEAAWPHVDPSPFMSNWAIDSVCDHLEAVMLGQISNLLINIPPRCAKPVWEEEWVVEQTKGRVKLKDIVVNDCVLTALGSFGRVSAVHQQGELPLVELATDCGRTLKTAPDHPILTAQGWKNAESLTIDDFVAITSPLVPYGDSTILSPEEARLIGYLIGDGTLVLSNQPGVTTISEEVSKDVEYCASKLGFFTRRELDKRNPKGCWNVIIKSHPRRWNTNRDGPAPFRVWLNKHELSGKDSYNKRVPKALFKAPANIIADFLGAYWSCDGHISGRSWNKGRDIEIGCASVSKELLDDIQHLLTKLGIFSRVRRSVQKLKTKKQGEYYVHYRMSMSRTDDRVKFAQTISVIQKQRAERLAAFTHRNDFDKALTPCKIISIVDAGVGLCRCLTVEGPSSTFTANDIAVHNTTVVSIMYPAWIWLRYQAQMISPLSGPQVKFLCAGYSDKLTLLSSTAFRRLVESEWYQQLNPNLSFMRDQNTKSHMDNSKGGSRQSTSVGGSLLGLGGDILIADDLNNTETEKLVETGAERARTISFFNEFRSTRRNDPRPGHSAVVGVQQRTNEGDMSGSWLDSEDDITHLMIPMRHDPLRHSVTVVLPQYDDVEPWEDPRTEDSELMWPERFNEFAVAGLEKALGPYMASGRLQQLPSPKGGGIIQRDYWVPWGETEAAKYQLEWRAGLREMPDMELVVASLDTAYKEKEENDYNAFTIWGIFLDKARNRRAMLMYAWMKRLPLNGKVVSAFPHETKVMFEQRMKDNWGLVDWVADGCKRYKVKRLLIEDKSRGHDVANEIRRLHNRENWGVQLVNPVGDKISRAHSVIPLFTDDAIYAPFVESSGTFIRWADQVVTQCAKFPKDVHDDLVDSVTQFLSWARDNELLARADEITAANEEAAMFKHKELSVAEQYGV